MPSERQVYLLDPQKLNPETIAVTFAKTSRSPMSFKDIAAELSDEQSAEFNQKWVIGYGHASVAEHAVMHIAIENISRLAIECLESNRLASYTEKSTRYQKWGSDQFYTPLELNGHALNNLYQHTCRILFENYLQTLTVMHKWAIQEFPQLKNETIKSWERRIRSEYIDVCRFYLPASALVNVGVTINARSLEHALRKMYSHPLDEVNTLGRDIEAVTTKIVPSLIKYINAVPYLQQTRQLFSENASRIDLIAEPAQDWCRLIRYDSRDEERILAACLYRFGNESYPQFLNHVQQMSSEDKNHLATILLAHLDSHDIPLRELEHATLTFDLILDQGAYNELKRHRMMTQTPQSLTTLLGYATPKRFIYAGIEQLFHDSMGQAQQTYEQLAELNPALASYIVPNAFNRRILITLNLRTAIHLITLRTAPNAHFSIRRVALRFAEEIHRVFPLLGSLIQIGTNETWQEIENSYFSKTH